MIPPPPLPLTVGKELYKESLPYCGCIVNTSQTTFGRHMSPSILTAFPARFSSSALSGSTSRAHDSLRLAFPTTSSEAHLQTLAIPTHASIYLEREWAIPAGCDFPGASFFSSQFANLKSFPVRSLPAHRSYRTANGLTYALCVLWLDVLVFWTLGRQR